MSKMKWDNKPPLARSPTRLLRSRRVQPTTTSTSAAATSIQTPPGYLSKTKIPLPNRRSLHENILSEYNLKETKIPNFGGITKTKIPNGRSPDVPNLQPKYNSISCEFEALAKMVHNEFGQGDIDDVVNGKTLRRNSSPLFERGRFYELYSARRNERLRKKNGETIAEPKTAYNLGVKVDSTKRSNVKKFESVRKSGPVSFSVDRSEKSRYLLRSSRDGKKATNVAVAVSFDGSAIGARKIVARRA